MRLTADINQIDSSAPLLEWGRVAFIFGEDGYDEISLQSPTVHVGGRYTIGLRSGYRVEIRSSPEGQLWRFVRVDMMLNSESSKETLSGYVVLTTLSNAQPILPDFEVFYSSQW